MNNQITENVVNQHCANGTTRGRTYGSLEMGFKVQEYRAKQTKHYLSLGLSMEQALIKAGADVVVKFGEPQQI